MEPTLVQLDEAPPDRLIGLVLHATTATGAAAYREHVVDMISSFSGIAAMPMNVVIGSPSNETGWMSLIERFDMITRLISGATGKLVRGNVARLTPDLAEEFGAKERAAVARMQKFIEQIEDAVDNAACDAVMAKVESGDETLIPYDQVRKELGLS